MILNFLVPFLVGILQLVSANVQKDVSVGHVNELVKLAHQADFLRDEAGDEISFSPGGIWTHCQIRSSVAIPTTSVALIIVSQDRLLGVNPVVSQVDPDLLHSVRNN